MVIAGLIVATFIDFEHYIIPNEITFGGIIVGLLVSAAYPPLMDADFDPAVIWCGRFWRCAGWRLVAAGGCDGGRRLIFRKEAMGMGDVKFLAAIGAFFGWQIDVVHDFGVVAAGGSGRADSGDLGSKKGWQSRIPYGPYIAFGAVLWMFCGQ